MKLKDLCVVVTGSGRGIGRSIAVCCAEEGARVVINDINSSNLRESRAILESKGTRPITFEGDVSKQPDAQGLIDAAIKEFGRIDVLVNNAGIMNAVPFLDITERNWDDVVRVNLKGAFNCSQCAAKQMVRQRSGRIIHISSRSYLGAPQMAHYAASKAGILGLMRCMALELGPFGITVNAIAPGMVDTELTRSISGDFMKDRIQATPLRRAGTPEDIANAVVFLASPGASYITGEVLHVTGGFY